MGAEVRLLGRPTAVRDGQPVRLRGHKPWLLLALLLLHGHPLTRDRLARLLFVDAEDPGGALRCSLSELRRHLGLQLAGDPVALVVPADVVVDVQVVLSADTGRAAEVPGLDEDVLAGVRPEPASELAVWLEDERQRLRRAGLDVRAHSALERLGCGDVEGAVALARQVARADPLDEGAAALLARCLRAAGDLAEAGAVADRAAERLRDALGEEPTGRARVAATARAGDDHRRVALARLDVGVSAVSAGAADAGIAALHGAVAAATDAHDPDALARACVALGSALVHSVRGARQEGLSVLLGAVPLTRTLEDRAPAVAARREVGCVSFLRGHYDEALLWFDRARRASDGTAGQTGWIDAYAGTVHDDVGASEAAARLFRRALEATRAAHDPRLEAYTLGVVGRHHLLRGELEPAETALRSALRVVHALAWTGYRPWPEALLADVLRRRGDLPGASALSEQALVLAEQLGDPCWQAVALRSLGLVLVDAGELDRGVALLLEVPSLCRRWPDTYRWMELWGCDALVDVAGGHRLPQAGAWAAHLEAEASALGVQPFARRARTRAAALSSASCRP